MGKEKMKVETESYDMKKLEDKFTNTIVEMIKIRINQHPVEERGLIYAGILKELEENEIEL